MTSPNRSDMKSPLLPDLRIRPVRAEETAALAGLTARSFSRLLAEGIDDPDFCHLVALAGDVPVGLLLSRRDREEDGRQEILSVMVTPLFRRQGVGRALIAHLWERVARAGLQALAVRWSDRLPQRESFLGLLRRTGWGDPSPERLRMSFNLRDAQEALLLARRPIARARAAGLSSLPLAALGEDGMARLLAAAAPLSARGLMPEWAEPAPWVGRLDPAVTQVLLKADGEISGWLLAEEQPSLKRHAAPVGWCPAHPDALFLAAEAWLGALEAKAGPGATLILQPTYRNGARLASLLDRHFRPHALWADQLVISLWPLGEDTSSSARRGKSM